MKPALPLLLSTAAVLLAMLGQPAQAQTAAPITAAGYVRVADAYSFPVGDLQITALSDGTVPQDLYTLMLGTAQAHVDDLLHSSFQSNPVEASINAFLIRGGDHTILVDTGSGDLFGPGYGGKLLDSLKSVGVTPDAITDILITHIHTDHTGGLVQAGKPVFANATVHVGAPDVSFFLDATNAGKTGYDAKYFDEAAKTVGVYQALGQVRTFADGETVLPGITGSIHPGHTPGSAFFHLVSKGLSITFVGDIVHVEAVQFPDPKVAILYDVKPDQAVATREQAFGEFAGDRALIAAPHLPFPGVGHVRREGPDSFSFHPIEYRNRDGK